MNRFWEKPYGLKFEECNWLVYGLLFGRVDDVHPLYGYLSKNGFAEGDLEYFREHPAEPDILGINYYPHLTTTEFLSGGGRRNVWVGTPGIEELIRSFHARYGKPVFWTETSVAGTVAERVEWLRESVDLVYRLRDEGLPLVGYTWWPLFSLVDWDYREGEKPVESYLIPMGMYDLERVGSRLARVETPVVETFRALAERGDR